MSEDLQNRLERLEGELQELRDREAIREVIHRYCQAVDRCDLEMLKSCYHPDGYDDHGFFAGNAHEFAEYVIPCLARIDSSMHAITNTRFKFDGKRAACTSQWSVIHRLKNEDGFTDFWHQGRYLDVFEKRDHEWKILHRVIAGDFDRWIHTLDIRSPHHGSASPAHTPPRWAAEGSPNRILRGKRGQDDPGNLWFDLLRHRPERPAVADLWEGYQELSKATRRG